MQQESYNQEVSKFRSVINGRILLKRIANAVWEVLHERKGVVYGEFRRESGVCLVKDQCLCDGVKGVT